MERGSARREARRAGCGNRVHFDNVEAEPACLHGHIPSVAYLREPAMYRLLASLALLLTIAPRLAAQHLRDELSALFIFGAGQDPLFLGGTGDPNNPESVRIHGNHFIPAAVASNGTVISFLTNSIGS